MSGNGAIKVGPEDIQRMIQEHEDQRQYEFDEDSVKVLDVSDEVAIIVYKLLTIPPGGGAKSEAYDSDVWVKRDGQWRCALHAEASAA